MPRDPQLDAALAAAKAERDSALASIRSMTASVSREHAAFRQGRRERDEERAKKARAGELGPEMQELQRRIDAGQTTWDDVLSGADEHPSALAARSNIERNLSALATVVQADPDTAEEAAETTAAQERMEREAGGLDGPGPQVT